MAKKPTKKHADNGDDVPAGHPYFLSLSLRHARCFVETQMLRLHDAQGRPARWTIILGDNGTGKTTLLRALAAFSFFFRTARTSNRDGHSRGW